MNNNYPKHGQGVKLSLRLATVPQAYIPIGQVAAVLGVTEEQAVEWCVGRQLVAMQIGGKWWVTEGDLETFVAGCTWQLVSAPLQVKRGRS